MADDRPLEDQVQHRSEDGVAWITLDRPEVGNALTPDQRDRVIALLAEASGDLATRAVVLTATGKAFCTGADLRAPRDAPARPEGAPDRAVGDVSRTIRDGAQRLVAAVLDCEVPVIAAVNGTAAGIGAHLAFACDLVLAADSARFIEVFVRRGIVPDGGGAYLLPRLVGPQRAKELMFLGDSLPAADAERMGLVNRVVPADELAAVAGEWAGRLAAGPTRSLALTKWLVNRSLESDRAGAFADEALAQELAMHSADAQEGIAAFVERRDPTYQGW
ncbi:enoyl-CoA hydratase-related protein [Iamia majanohamensis]|uniref:Enoyl-CoA hydratase-related protein n=1 Tax=Iamia majanohamensis TaxID=467976 RepID=A0AAE9Y3N9_9ACTN|nr:enoyl-CoA hydratase-related protein [Iamia majanohamensis]WCO65930.1 enoyl-CoA hydratase-related protein [Iamia majanohamensis]